MIRDRAEFACQTVSTDLLADHFPDSWGLLPRRIDSVVSLVDLFWTVLAAVRTPTPELPDIPPLGRGQNLLPIVRDPSLADADRAILCEANYPTPPLRQRPLPWLHRSDPLAILVGDDQGVKPLIHHPETSDER